MRRYVLVPRTGEAGHVRRYSLARLGVSRRSALGEDRHERLERIAGLGPAAASRKQPARPAARG